mgnify:CR=1 FL=1
MTTGANVLMNIQAEIVNEVSLYLLVVGKIHQFKIDLNSDNLLKKATEIQRGICAYR